MKTLRLISVFLMIWAGITSATADPFFYDSGEWPFTPPTLFLTSGANAVTAGTSLLFWSLGDTITVIQKSDFTVLSTFRVETSTAIQDMLYDESDHILYVAAGFDEKPQSGGLQIFNLSVPASPVLTVVFDESTQYPGSLKTQDINGDDVTVAMPHIDARGLGLHNDIIYLSDDNYGLRIINVTNPANPTEVLLATPILGDDNTTNLDDRITGYKQGDINNEFAATGGYINLSLYPFNGKIYAFVLDFYNGVKVFDVTDPAVIAEPFYKDTRSLFWYGRVSLLSDIFVTETEGRLTALVTGLYFDDKFGEDGVIYAVVRLDATLTGNNPLTNLGRYDELSEAWSVCSSGDYAYVAQGVSGLAVVDIVHGGPDPDPDVTVLFYPKVGTYAPPNDLAYNVFLEGTTLYLSMLNLGLTRINVSNPASPAHFGTDNAPPITGDDVCMSGNYIYMLDRDKGLRIFDSTTPANPLLRSFLSYTGPSTDLAVSGNYAYIADSSNYISIVNVTNPLAPVLEASTIASTDPDKLFISGNVLYIASSTAGLSLVDITDPLNPVALGSYAASTSAVSVYVHANRAYVAREGIAGVDIIDVADTGAPAFLANVPMSGARDVSVLENGGSVYALVADGEAGLKIQDVTDLANLPAPVVVANMDTNTSSPLPFTAASTVTVLGNNAYVGLGSDGVLALDLSNPLSPIEIDHKTTISESGDIVAYLRGAIPFLAVAEKNKGFRILYLNSSEIDPPAPLDPSEDAGCFIGAASDKMSVTGWGKRWTESILSVLGRLFPYCNHNETDSGTYLKWRI